VRSGKWSKYEENEYKSSLGCLRQKPINALNSTRIGGGFKHKKISKFFPQKLVRSGKSSKYEANEYKSSRGCLGQKPTGALNTARIRVMLSQKKFQNFFSQKLVRSGKSSK
jgi:hypothetical protein